MTRTLIVSDECGTMFNAADVVAVDDGRDWPEQAALGVHLAGGVHVVVYRPDWAWQARDGERWMEALAPWLLTTAARLRNGDV